MADGNVSRREQRMLESRDKFRRNAFLLITEILELSEEPLVVQQLVAEALHSIFFLGRIITISPEEILAGNATLLANLQETYPQPFQRYTNRVPQRHPMSCVLEMIVRVSGERNENHIKERLQQTNFRVTRETNETFLTSSTMCVSQNTEIPDSVRYYGVSMSTSGGRSRDIMIAASCCVYWNTHVADAVMTYYPNNIRRGDFDGTIILPENVRCQAFSIQTEPSAAKPPCESCKDLFGLRTTPFAYGNCAEVESVSNLFGNEPEIIAQSHLNVNTAESRQQVRRSTWTRLRGLLGFHWDNMFYPNLAYTI